MFVSNRAGINALSIKKQVQSLGLFFSHPKEISSFIQFEHFEQIYAASRSNLRLVTYLSTTQLPYYVQFPPLFVGLIISRHSVNSISSQCYQQSSLNGTQVIIIALQPSCKYELFPKFNLRGIPNFKRIAVSLIRRQIHCGDVIFSFTPKEQKPNSQSFQKYARVHK